MRAFGIFNFFFILLSYTTRASAHHIYVVKPGDTLFSILKYNKITPIYGKRGSLVETIKINPWLKKSSGNFILPGMRIRLSKLNIAKIDYSVPFVEEQVTVAPNTPLVLREVAAEARAAPAEVMEAAPVKVIESAPVEFEQYSYFTLSPRSSIITVNTVDNSRFGGTDITNSSKSSMGVKGEWRVVASPDFSTYLFSSIDFLSFYKDTSFSLTDTSFKRTSFGAGADVSLSPTSRIESQISANQNYFIEMVSTTNVQMRELTQVEVKSNYVKDIYNIGKVKSQLGVGAMVILPSSRKEYKSKLGYGLDLDWRVRFLSKEMQFSYVRKEFKVNNNKNTVQEIMASLNFEFGKEK